MGNKDSRNNGEAKWDEHIRSGQGFFVKANSATSIAFNNNMLVTGNNSDGGFFRTENHQSKEVKAIKLLLNDGQNSKATIVGFANDALDGVDKQYDALSLSGGDYGFYSLFEGNAYAIQGLPSSYDKEIPLGFAVPVSGQFAIRLSFKESDESLDMVFLIDQLTGEIVNLREGSYSFTSNAGRFEDRFVIQTIPGNVTDVKDELNHQVYSYVDKGLLGVVFRNGSFKNATIHLHDLNGREVLREKTTISSERWSKEVLLVDSRN